MSGVIDVIGNKLMNCLKSCFTPKSIIGMNAYRTQCKQSIIVENAEQTKFLVDLDIGIFDWIGLLSAIIIPILVTYLGFRHERIQRKNDFLYQERVKFYSIFFGYVKDIANALYNFINVYECDIMQFNDGDFGKCNKFLKREASFSADILFNDEKINAYIKQLIENIDALFDEVMRIQNILSKKNKLTSRQINHYINRIGKINNRLFELIDDKKVQELFKKYLKI